MPDLARSLGKSIREFKKAASSLEEELKRALETPPPPPPPHHAGGSSRRRTSRSKDTTPTSGKRTRRRLPRRPFIPRAGLAGILRAAEMIHPPWTTNPNPSAFPSPASWICILSSPLKSPSLLEEYLAECRERGLTEVRIIHGKGTGTLRETVHALLRRSTLRGVFPPGR